MTASTCAAVVGVLCILSAMIFADPNDGPTAV